MEDDLTNFAGVEAMNNLHRNKADESSVNQKSYAADTKQFMDKTLKLDTKGEFYKIEGATNDLNIRVEDKCVEDLSPTVTDSLEMVGLNKQFHRIDNLLKDNHSEDNHCSVEHDFEVYYGHVKEEKEDAAIQEGCVPNLTFQNDDAPLKTDTGEGSSVNCIHISSDLLNYEAPGENTFKCPYPSPLSENHQAAQINASTLFQSKKISFDGHWLNGTFQDKLDFDQARRVVSDKKLQVGKSNAILTSVKAASMPSEMNTQLTETPMKCEFSADDEIFSETLCMERDKNSLSVGSGVHPGNFDIQEEQKLIGAGIAGAFLKSSFSALLRAVSLAGTTGVPGSVLIQHSFKASQKIQLYAQILVYASLVQESVPGEALMVAAFGHNEDDWDGLWGKSWCIAAERFQRNKPFDTYDMLTPTNLSSVSLTCDPEIEFKTPNQSLGKNVTNSSGFSYLETRLFDKEDTPISGSIINNNISSTVSSAYPVSLSPLVWESPRPFDFRFSNMERSPKCDQTKEMHYEFFKHNPGTITPLILLDTQNEGIDVKGKSIGKYPVRKRMKNHIYGEVDGTDQCTPGRIFSKCISESEPFAVDIGGETNDIFNSVSSISPLDYVCRSQMKTLEAEQRHISLVGIGSSLEKDAFNAEEASSIAASVVMQNQIIWSQLCSKRNSGLISDCDAILASSDAAAAVATYVSKAALAAAKVAYETTMQAKLMTEEAICSHISSDANVTDDMGSDDTSIGNATSTLAPEEKDTCPNFQVESSCKAIDIVNIKVRKQKFEGQNFHTILKTAKLVEKSVSLVRTVMATNYQLFNTLVECGSGIQLEQPSPEAQTSETFKTQCDGVESSQGKGNKFLEQSVTILKSNGHGLCKDEMPIKTKDNLQNDMPYSQKKDTNPSDRFVKFNDVNGQLKVCKEGLTGERNETFIATDQSLIPQIQSNLPDCLNCEAIQMQKEADIQTNFSGSEIEAGPQEEVPFNETAHDIRIQDTTLAPKSLNIMKGSNVEVLTNEIIQRAWFSAYVLCLKEDKALVHYDRVLSDASPNQHQEWISLCGESGEHPRIRLIHPIVKYEGMRKRKRIARDTDDWFVGDHVDAWINNGWWEGLIVGKSKDDEDELTVHFSERMQENIKFWNLRPSLVWTNGQWVEWTRTNAGPDVETIGGLYCRKRRKLNKDATLRDTIDAGNSGEMKVQKLNTMIQKSENKSPASPSQSVSTTSKKIGQKGLDKGRFGKVCGVPRPENKTKPSLVNQNFAANKTPQILPTGRITRKPATNKAAVISNNQIGQRTRNPRPAVLKPKDLKFGNAQVIDESKTKDTIFATPISTGETSGHDSNSSGATSSMERRKAVESLHFEGYPSNTYHPNSAQYLPVLGESKIPRPFGLIKTKCSPSKQLQQQSKEKLPFTSFNQRQGSKKANVQDPIKRKLKSKK